MSDQQQRDSKIGIERVCLTALSPQERQSVNAVIQQSSNSSVFHSLEWNQLITKEFELRNVTLLATQNQRPVGLYIFYVDGAACRSPMQNVESVYGGPHSIGDDKVIGELLRAAERSHRMCWSEIWTPPYFESPSLINVGYSHEEVYTSIVNLERPEKDLWMSLDGKRRNTIRKAEKSGVRVIQGGVDLVDEYYEMIVSTMSKGQIDILPKSFYRRVVGQLGAEGVARLFLAQHNGQFIAGAIFLFHKDTAYYWHGASFRDRLSVAPNDLIQWELVKWANRNGYKQYDLVRIEPDRLPGIAKFKMSFGGETVAFQRWHKLFPGYQLRRALRFAASPKRIRRRLLSRMAS